MNFGYVTVNGVNSNHFPIYKVTYKNDRILKYLTHLQCAKIDHYLNIKRTPQEYPNGVRLTLFINQYFREYQNYNFYIAFTLLIQRLLPLSLPVLLLFPLL